MKGTQSYWHSRADVRSAEYDVIIVGAGITGASTAYWLRRQQPSLRTCILEREEVAAGASGRNAGFLLKGIATNHADAVRTLGQEQASWFYGFTAKSISDLIEAVPAAVVGLETKGSLLAAGDETEDEDLRKSTELLRTTGTAVQYWKADELNERLSSARFHGGLYDPTAGEVDPVRLVRYLIGSSITPVYELHEVDAIESDPSGHRVETPRGAFTARTLILATNAYLPKLLPETSKYIRPIRAQMLHAVPARPVVLPCPVYSHQGYYYVRSMRDGSLLVGGARHLHVDEEVGYDDVTTPELQFHLEEYVQSHFPTAGSLDVRDRWSGVMAFSPDGLPLIGRTSAGILWAGGYTGHGMAFGFGIGRLLARMALGETADEGLRRFHPERVSA